MQGENAMPFYKKKPVVIEARRLNTDNVFDIILWLGDHNVKVEVWRKSPTHPFAGLIIPTLEGNHEASFGDYIIKGIAGEFYPCKPSIFSDSYEEVINEQ